MTPAERAERRNEPATNSEVWMPLLMGCTIIVVPFFLLGSLIYAVQGRYRRALVVFVCTAIGCAMGFGLFALSGIGGDPVDPLSLP